MKMQMRSKLVALGGTAILALAACASGGAGETSPDPVVPTEAANQDTIEIGMVVKSLAVDFWQQVVAGGEAIAEEYDNVEITAYAPDSESNVEQQINQVESLIAQGVAAIVVAPVAPVQMLPVLERAHEAGIHVVILDTRVEGFEDMQVAYVGTDNRNGGFEAGSFIVEQLGGSGNIGLINGTPGVPAVEDRLAGVRDALEGTDVEISGETAALDCTTDNGVRAAEDLLSANPDLQAMFVACGPAAVGAQNAVRSANLNWNEFVLVGFDAAPGELSSIAALEQRATIAQDQAAMGGDSVRAAIMAVLGEPIEERVIDPGVQVVTSDNVNEFTE